MQITADAKLGTTRQIANAKFDTATVVNEALTVANSAELDLAYAETYLRRLGHTSPDTGLVEQVAYQKAALDAIETLTGCNAGDQIGKWNFRSAATVLAAFDSYLNRRIQGQRARYTASRKGR